MTATTTILSRKHYVLLGKFLLEKEPEVANRLLSTYFPHGNPPESDLSRIKYHFLNFCRIQDINPEDHLGAVYKSQKVSTRRLFVAAMIHLYNPQVYHQPIEGIILNAGFVHSVASALNTNKGNMSKMIREVIIWERNYEDFTGSVSSTIQKLTNDGSTEGK